MSGVLMAAGKSAAAPPPALHAGYGWTGGINYNVNAASGNLFALAGAVISGGPNGGTAPLTGSITWVSSDGGHSSIVPAVTDPHDTIGWNGLAVGDYAFGHFVSTATDSSSPPQTDNQRIPASGEILIHRTS